MFGATFPAVRQADGARLFRHVGPVAGPIGPPYEQDFFGRAAARGPASARRDYHASKMLSADYHGRPNGAIVVAGLFRHVAIMVCPPALDGLAMIAKFPYGLSRWTRWAHRDRKIFRLAVVVGPF